MREVVLMTVEGTTINKIMQRGRIWDELGENTA
jgi:hypothetical protein